MNGAGKFVTTEEACRMLLSELIRIMVTWLMEKLDITLNGHARRTFDKLSERLGLA